MLNPAKITEKCALHSARVLTEVAADIAVRKAGGTLDMECARASLLQYVAGKQNCLLATRQSDEISGFLCGELINIPSDKTAVAPLVMACGNLAIEEYQRTMADLSGQFQQWATDRNALAAYMLLPMGMLPRQAKPVSRVYKRSFIAETDGSISGLSEPKVYRDGVLVDKEGREISEKNRCDKGTSLPAAQLLGPEGVGEMVDFVRKAQLGGDLSLNASRFAAWLEGTAGSNSGWRIFVWRRNESIAGLLGCALRQEPLSSDVLCCVAAFMVWDEAAGGRECRNTRSALTRGLLRWSNRKEVHNVYFVLPRSGDYWGSYCEEWKLLPYGIVFHAGDIARQWRVRPGDKVRIPDKNERSLCRLREKPV